MVDEPALVEDPDPEIADEDLEIVGDLPWLYHPLRAFLLEKIVSGEIPANYKLMKPRDVWETFCDADVFEGFEHDAAFTRRLLSLRKLVEEGKQRADKDLDAFKAAKQNHPPPARNHRDEPQWNGSEAQRLLKIDIANNLHRTHWPRHLYDSKPAYKEFSLDTFRDHIYQEVQTRKYLYTLKFRAQEKQKERIEAARKKAVAAHEKQKRAADKIVRETEIQAEKDRKAIEREEARERREAEKKAAAEAKKAATLAARAAKVAAKAAEKERIATEKREAKEAAKAAKAAEKERIAAEKREARNAAKGAKAKNKSTTNKAKEDQND